MRLLALLLALSFVTPAVAADLKTLKAMRDRARKAPSAQAPDLWYELAQESRSPARLNQGVSLQLLDQENKMIEKSGRPPIFREALSHLDTQRLSMLAANLKDPEVSVAMVAAMHALGRDGEAAAECRSALAQWSPGDVPTVVDACKECRAQFVVGAGAASFPVFRHWIAAPDAGEYGRGLYKGLGPWMARVMMVGGSDAHMLEDGFGVVIGDPSSHAAALARAFHVPFVALTPGVWPRDPKLSAVPVGTRVLVPRPGPNALAARLLESAKRQGAKLVAQNSGSVAYCSTWSRFQVATYSAVTKSGSWSLSDNCRNFGTGKPCHSSAWRITLNEIG